MLNKPNETQKLEHGFLERTLILFWFPHLTALQTLGMLQGAGAHPWSPWETHWSEPTLLPPALPSPPETKVTGILSEIRLSLMPYPLLLEGSYLYK